MIRPPLEGHGLETGERKETGPARAVVLGARLWIHRVQFLDTIPHKMIARYLPGRKQQRYREKPRVAGALERCDLVKRREAPAHSDAEFWTRVSRCNIDECNPVDARALSL
jgi:hypothetical protein